MPFYSQKYPGLDSQLYFSSSELTLTLQSQQEKAPSVMGQNFPSGTVGRASGSASPVTNYNLGQVPVPPLAHVLACIVGVDEASLTGWLEGLDVSPGYGSSGAT